MSDDDDQTRKDFDEAVNMTASELKKWLDTDESKSVGQKKDGAGESTGHESGRHIVRILEKKKADLTGDDYAHMRKVVGYVKRHSAQQPEGDITDTDWRYSLMNWGNDPKK
jgi:ribosomal protein S3AE